MAVVNNEPISREDLARECLLHYGQDVLESLINRTLILTSCQQRNIVITDKQIEEEIDRMAHKFSVGKDQWLKMLQQERGITPIRYAKDIIWPTLALRELARAQLTVTRAELDEAFESEFGPSVKVRLIALDSSEEARRVHALAVAKPDEFPALAKKYSKDPNSASAYGMIQPIRRHSGDSKLEQVAFALKPGQVSQIVTVGNLHVFLKCEEHIPPRQSVNRAKVEPLLVEALKDRKLREAASGVFKQLQDSAKIVIAYGDPAKSKEMPGVAAMINGQTISLLELAEECIDRHGEDVLDGAINRRLLDQSLRRRKLAVDRRRDRSRSGTRRAEHGQDHRRWPAGRQRLDRIPDPDAKHHPRGLHSRRSLALGGVEALVSDHVEVTEEDLKKGYEANYGPKSAAGRSW